jgi:hypothetical protein
MICPSVHPHAKCVIAMLMRADGARLFRKNQAAVSENRSRDRDCQQLQNLPPAKGELFFQTSALEKCDQSTLHHTNRIKRKGGKHIKAFHVTPLTVVAGLELEDTKAAAVGRSNCRSPAMTQEGHGVEPDALSRWDGT